MFWRVAGHWGVRSMGESGQAVDCAIIGGGVAGLQAATTLRRRWPNRRVLLIDPEREIGYFRALLPQFMARSIDEKRLFFWHPDDDRQVEVRTGVSVQALDRNSRFLTLDDGTRVDYDRLIIASGGHSLVPPVCNGGPHRGMFPIRGLAAAQAVRSWLPGHASVVVLGGGLVGIKTAIALADAGLTVILIEKRNWLLSQAITPEAARLIEAHLRRKNISLFLGRSIDDLRVLSGEITGVRTGTTWLSCQTLLVAAGSTPDVGFLRDSGLLKEGKLIVSNSLQTNDRYTFAAGDVVTISGTEECTPWTWPQAVIQGKLAAINCYETQLESVARLTRVNSMNLNGLSLTVLGAPVAGATGFSYSDDAAGIYRELYFKDGRIVGGALVGDSSGAGHLHAMMVSGERHAADVEALVRPSGSMLPRTSWSYKKRIRRAYLLPAIEG